MIPYGLTPEGLNIRRLQDIRDNINADIKGAFGPVDTHDKSVLGQLSGVHAKPAADLWEQLAALYYNLNPNTAEGVYLDYIVAFNGLIRLDARSSVAKVGVAGSPGAIIPMGALFEAPLNGCKFRVTSDYVLSLEDKPLLYLEVIFAANTLYEFKLTSGIDEMEYGFNSAAYPDEEILLETIAGVISTGPLFSAVNLQNGCIAISPKQYLSMSLIIGTTDSLKGYMPVTTNSVDIGPIPVGSKTITVVSTPLSGVDVINNFEEGQIGRDREKDPELRIRREETLTQGGGGSVSAIAVRIRDDVPGVITAKCFENTSDVPVAGRPPHCIELLVIGGDDQKIADTLWKVKGGGIQTYSANIPPISKQTIDSNGDPQTMFFTRPSIIYGWVNVLVTLYSEELFPSDGIDRIKRNIVEYGLTFTIGLDNIPVRYIPSIVAIPGIESVVVEIANTLLPSDAPAFTTSVIPVINSQLLQLDISRISVMVV